GDVILHSSPLYGGTETLIMKTMPHYGVEAVGFIDGCDHAAIDNAVEKALAKGRIGVIFAETPANPTNALVDLQYLKAVADKLGETTGHRPPVVVDNTFLGPVFSHPLQDGADIAIYSLTKYIGGHSDLVAGAITGTFEWARPVKLLRGSLGTQLDPNTSWMVMRSLETLTLRMERANENAKTVAEFLSRHDKVEGVNYLGFLEGEDPRKAVFDRQCIESGSTFAFYVKGGEPEAFRMLDKLEVIKLAVSLGGTESLISHPASTTHSGVPAEIRAAQGVSDAMIRISVGIEAVDDLIADLDQALAAV
ncbi:MAG: PLP-dependent transferase, partial [Pseudomonadota bacterium]